MRRDRVRFKLREDYKERTLRRMMVIRRIRAGEMT